MTRPPRTQRGAALLIALLAVALAATLAVGLIEDQRGTLARTQALADAERSWQFARGLEGLAADWIRRARRGEVPDALLDGRWSAPFAVPGGSVRVRLLARSDRFNLNALAARDPVEADAARLGLARLLATLDLDPDLADALFARLHAGGRPLRMIHLSEARAVPGWTPSVEARLAPFVTVLPDPASRVDINSAPPEVLAARLPSLGLDAARRIHAQRPYARIEDLRAHPDLQALAAVDLDDRIRLGGRWYLAHAEIVLNGRLHEQVRLLDIAGAGYDARYVSTGLP
ncbi:type II secretion system minor pseudopilin GspK [Wenzhouxiangella sp. XN79A]|uniref:type II secretion system minor pseudopilin GspK n=1 Tax=Wenzhouxiangella sp. XN79A TaxID=2724193 RepID=UPI00144AEAB0|nr:type II secretion system minor pseudopilin GspK [Wenzhouxiangella sp. XN79A]